MERMERNRARLVCEGWKHRGGAMKRRVRGFGGGVFLRAFLVLAALLPGAAWGDGGHNLRWEPREGGLRLLGSPDLGFDPEAYRFLVYSCNGAEDSIEAAMTTIGLTYTLRNSSYPVTLNDLATHDLLIVGWDGGGGSKSGLHTSVIEAGITGRVILSGHDSDYHTIHGPSGKQEYAERFFIQEIRYVLRGGRTGMIVCADVGDNFAWLPASWGVVAELRSGETISAFTQEGLESGIYEGLTPVDMSNWGTAYHNVFTEWGRGFEPLEVSGEEVVTIATPLSPWGVYFDKEDDVELGHCVNPEEEITYTIQWDNTHPGTLEDAYIIDWLPRGVTYPNGEWTFGFDPNVSPPIVLYPPDPGYDALTHSYVWPLGTIDPNASGFVQLTVVVNEGAEPGRYLRNMAELWTTVYDANGLNPQPQVVARAYRDTLVCCWDMEDGILYVDQSATGANSGVSWQNAYTDLQSALLRARTTECLIDYVIYVAEGSYSPGQNESDTFHVPDGAHVYGGFQTGGCPFEERDPKRYETTLTGRIDETTRNDTIVTMGNNTLLSGFQITKAGVYGIYGSSGDFSVEHCAISDSWEYGLRAIDCNVNLTWCNIRNSQYDGIRHEGQGFVLQVENCWIRQSGRYGLYCANSTPVVMNSIISESDLAEAGNAGIRMITPAYSPFLQNVTIAHNRAVGVSLVGNTLPELQNCIVYHNNSGGPQLAGFSADEAAWFSCIQDCNSVNNNISVDPQFAYFDPNNMRIAFGSPCRDTGNPFLNYQDQLEMDRKDRVYGAAVDRGAYEITCEDISNEWDWNADGIVNLHEFARLAAVWGAHDPNDPVLDPNHPDHGYTTDPNSPYYVSAAATALWNAEGHKYNFANTGQSEYRIDLADLAVLLDEGPWLWMACWRYEEVMQGMMFSQGAHMQMMGREEQFVELESIESQMKSMVRIIVQLQELWLTDPDIQQEIDSGEWQRFLEVLYNELGELYLSSVNTW